MPSSAELFAPYQSFIPDFAAFRAALQAPVQCCLRVNTLRISPAALQERLVRQGLQVSTCAVLPDLLLVDNLSQPGSLPEALMGYYQPQALTSALASHLVAPQPGERLCDLCAAPGSKATHLAQLMHNQGLIVANELRSKRLYMLEYNLKRLGISNVVTTVYPGQHFPLRQKFDRVLVDAPCSGEGNYRWDTQGRLLHARRLSGRLPPLQTALLVRGFDLLTPGGHLIYATCTYNPEENEAVVQALLEQRPDAALEPFSLPYPHHGGLQHWKGTTYDASMAYCWRLYPHDTRSVGFFLAHIRARTTA